MQKFQDWFTQQWIIIWGKKIDPKEYSWLMGPFGNLDGIGENFIHQLAKNENLKILRNCKSVGLLESIHILNLSEAEKSKLSKKVIDFYENTADYQLNLKLKWNPFFRILGYIVNRLFSQRINQLNIPTKQINKSEVLTSEIIQLIEERTNKVKYTIWLRKFESNGVIAYSGIYETCTLPSGATCVKAIFPLPKGNATVILKASVNEKSELILKSSGSKFGDAGFYFLLNDSKNNYWSQYHSSFTEQLTVSDKNNIIHALQSLKLWNLKVVTFEYIMNKATTQ